MLRSPAAFLLAAALALTPFLPTLGYDFVWDDPQLILLNPFVKSWTTLPDLFASDYATLSGGFVRPGYYRPLLALSFLLDYRLWGAWPGGFHLTNAILHAGVVVVLVLLARSLGLPPTGTLLAGALFALHPAHVEPVAFISARVDLLAALFCLLAGWAFLRAEAAEGRLRWAWAGASALAFLFALLSKEMAATLPMVLVLLVWCKNGSQIGQLPRERLVLTLPHWGVLAGYLALRMLISPLRLTDAHAGAPPFPGSRPLTALALLGEYALLGLAAAAPTPIHVVNPVASPADARALGGAIALGALAALAWWTRRRLPVAAFGLGWFLVTLLPVLNLVPVSGPLPVGMADRYLYLPSAGLALAAAATWSALAERVQGTRAWRVMAAGTAVVLAALGAASLAHLPVWRNDLSLTEWMVGEHPEVSFVHNNYGIALRRAGRLEEATAAYRKAVRLDPMAQRPRLNLARAYHAQGDLPRAIAELEGAAVVHPKSSGVLIMLGGFRAEAGDLDGAQRTLEAAISLAPGSAEAHDALGGVLAKAGDHTEAVGRFRRALALNPRFPPAYFHLARSLLALGRLEEARTQVEAGLLLAPESRQGRELLVAILARGSP